VGIVLGSGSYKNVWERLDEDQRRKR